MRNPRWAGRRGSRGSLDGVARGWTRCRALRCLQAAEHRRTAYASMPCAHARTLRRSFSYRRATRRRRGVLYPTVEWPQIEEGVPLGGVTRPCRRSAAGLGPWREFYNEVEELFARGLVWAAEVSERLGSGKSRQARKRSISRASILMPPPRVEPGFTPPSLIRVVRTTACTRSRRIKPSATNWGGRAVMAVADAQGPNVSMVALRPGTPAADQPLVLRVFRRRS